MTAKKAPEDQKNDALPVEMAGESPTLANSASNAAVVPLAGVPETPLSNAGPASVGPAVPSTDHYVSELSPNKETSSEASAAPDATKAAAGEL
jgi:hypothetical protein